MDFLLLEDLAAFKEFAEVLGSLDLSLMSANLVHLRIERLDAAVVCVE